MKAFLRPITWLSNPFFPIEHGYANGYVLLPKDHPWWGKNYDDIPVDVHGGLTFGREIEKDDAEKLNDTWSNYLTKEDEGFWMIGFDTAHHRDNMIDCDEAYCQRELDSLLKQCEEAYK